MESDSHSSNEDTVHQVIPVLIWMSTIQRSIGNKEFPSKKKLTEKLFLLFSQ